MKTNALSQREKTLLYILLCLVIVVVGWYFLVSPAMDRNKALQQEYDTLDTEYKINKEVVETYGDLDAANEKATSDIDIHKANFYDYVTTEEIDKLLTSLVKKYGLVPVSLSLEEATGQQLSAYSKETKKADGEDTKEASDSETKTDADENALIKVMNVKQSISTVKLSTNTAEYIESIRQLPGVHITSLSYSSGEGTTTINFEYKIYMLEK